MCRIVNKNNTSLVLFFSKTFLSSVVMSNDFSLGIKDILKDYECAMSVEKNMKKISLKKINEMCKHEYDNYVLSKINPETIYHCKRYKNNIQMIDYTVRKTHSLFKNYDSDDSDNSNEENSDIKIDLLLKNLHYYDLSIMDNKIMLCSAPLNDNVKEWWEMIIINKISFVTMLTSFIEKNREKSAHYYPFSEYNEDENGNINMHLLMVLATEPKMIYLGCKSFEGDYKNIRGLEKRELVIMEVENVDDDELSPGLTPEISPGLSEYVLVNVVSSDTLLCSGEYYDFFDVIENKKIRATKIIHTVTHLHYTKWKDNSTITTDTFVDLMNIFNDHHSSIPSDHNSVIHCSAGIGRAGTFYIGLNIVEHAQKMFMESNNNIENVILNIPLLIMMARRRRLGLIQTEEQLELLYDVINDILTKIKF